MKHLPLFIAVTFFSLLHAQTETEIISEIQAYQLEASEEFKNPKTSILDSLDLISFKHLEFYPIDLKYRLVAKFVRTPNEKPFLMQTSTDKLPEYVKYGEVYFTIDSKELKLSVYQSTSHNEQEGYENYLFIPYTDLTSGDGSYGGGKYIDSEIPKGDTILIDFNKAYNPYCAYSYRYSCPIPPKENDLLVRIEAGVKDFGHH